MATRTFIKIGLDMYLNNDSDELLAEYLDTVIKAGFMDDVDKVAKIMEEEEAYILYPFIVKSLHTDLMKLKGNLRSEC